MSDIIDAGGTRAPPVAQFDRTAPWRSWDRVERHVRLGTEEARTLRDAGQHKRVVDALRQRAINEVLEHHGGRPELVAIERDLVRALAVRGLASPSADWLEAVASGIRTGDTYVVSPESVRTARTLEFTDYQEYLAHTAEPGRRRTGAGNGPDADPAGAAADGAGPGLIGLIGRVRAAVGRDHVLAGGVIAVSVVTAVWASRSGRVGARGTRGT